MRGVILNILKRMEGNIKCWKNIPKKKAINQLIVHAFFRNTYFIKRLYCLFNRQFFDNNKPTLINMSIYIYKERIK